MDYFKLQFKCMLNPQCLGRSAVTDTPTLSIIHFASVRAAFIFYCNLINFMLGKLT